MKIDVWVMVDANGDYVVDTVRADVLTTWDNTHGPRDNADPVPMRLVRVTIDVPVPTVATVAVTIPAEPEPVATVGGDYQRGGTGRFGA